jgi:hypothetical protein
MKVEDWVDQRWGEEEEWVTPKLRVVHREESYRDALIEATKLLRDVAQMQGMQYQSHTTIAHLYEFLKGLDDDDA